MPILLPMRHGVPTLPQVPSPGPCEGVDYSFSRPDPACLKRSGKLFAVRYLGRDPRGGKDLTRAEADRLKAQGIARVSNYQPRRAFVPTFADDGRLAASQAHGDAVACGMPTGRPIYFSVDGDTTNFTASQWAPIDEFFREVNSWLTVVRTGAYGGKATLEHLLRLGLISWRWQTSSWSGGVWVAGANMRQYSHNVSMCGGSVDLNRAMTRDYGQW